MSPCKLLTWIVLAALPELSRAKRRCRNSTPASYGLAYFAPLFIDKQFEPAILESNDILRMMWQAISARPAYMGPGRIRWPGHGHAYGPLFRDFNGIL